MYYEVHTENIAARGHAPEIAQILRRFALHRRDGSAVVYEELAPALLPDFGEDLMILEPTDDGDYRWLHFGREIIRYSGASRLGQRLSGMREQVARFSADSFDQALAEDRPLYTVHRSTETVRVALWERLVLPTITHDGRRFVVAFSRPLQFREDLLNAVLESSPSGIVALRAIRDAAGQIEQAVVVTANRRAAELSGRPETDLLDTDGRESLTFLSDLSVWRRCLCAIDLQRADTLETSFTHDGTTTWLRVAIAPLGDGLLLTLTDITDLTVANQTLQMRAATLALEIGRERATRRALSEEICLREEREEELRRLAETDPLTALLNRRSFTDKANAAIAASEADGTALAMIIVDLDHFKQVNDTYGHPAGDAVIRACADLLLGQYRSEHNLVGRFGGEEFGILLQDCDLASAAASARQIQDALLSRAMPVSETLALKVTASLGIAARHPGEALASLTARADQALYRAKNEGRNRLGLADPLPVAEAA
ncbi:MULTISPECIES: GGDEF domain-containing protein [Bosea]|uniref:diguanylate cyclase n=1 Tax=Bosea robiniae TaxID=1036780 RepID=A0ABY0NQD6_9HYPH|nr:MULTISPECIES: GGDEF domain-containing protein [Bosea]TQI73056.1 diguanylate cyclase (GGDEF)-like protein [Bosea sp. AK1]SDF93081.1 diguanylate cyclase (GGDEF) domain-containing protein [Bosea robiniae]